MRNLDIDFVITWVDGNDSKWQKEKDKYIPDKTSDSKNSRYRDWELLKYWFRGVEKFAPWVRKIHFITYGHLPEWLNIDNKKLDIVKHEDYIPKKYLPTFNSHPIENNMHLIKDLSENFVYFNDDMFLIRKVEDTDFFKNNLPRDSFAENALVGENNKSIFSHILLNNMSLINQNFSKRKFLKEHFTKYFNLRYGMKNFRTLLLLPWNNFSLIYDTHIPVSLKKETLKKVWNKEYDAFDTTCSHKFRSINDFSQYTFRYWQILEGNFYPRSFKFGKVYSVKDNNETLCNAIEKQKYKVICINDNPNLDFEKAKKELQLSFEKILPEKSSFEK